MRRPGEGHGKITLVVIALLLGAALRFSFLDRSRLWFDESVGVILASKPPAELFRQCVVTEVKPPLYFLLIKPMAALEDAELLLRTQSIIFGVATVAALALLGAKLGSWQLGGTAALLAAVNPFLIHYSREVRMYALLTFLVVASTLLLMMGARSQGRRAVVAWSLYALSLAAGMLTHYYFGPVALAHLCYAVVVFRNKRTWRGFLLAGFGAAALCSFWLPYFARSLFALKEEAWQRKAEFSDLPNIFRHLSISYPSPRSSWIFAKVFIAISAPVFAFLFFRGLLARFGKRENRLLLFLMLFLPLALIFALAMKVSIYNARYFLMVCPFYVMFLAAGISGIRGAKARHVMLAAVLLLSSGSLAFYYSDPNYKRADVRGASEYILRQAGPEDAVVHLAYTTYFPSSFYLKEKVELFLLSPGPLPYYYGGNLIQPERLISSADELPPDLRRIWCVVEKSTEEWVHLTPPEEKVARLMPPEVSVLDRIEFHGVTVFLCQLPAHEES